MSLRRRIAAATALSVAAVAIAVGIVGYVSTRSHLIGEIKSELRARSARYRRAHRAGAPQLLPFAGRQGQSAAPGRQAAIPPGPALGRAPGYFQFVYPHPKVVAPLAAKPQPHLAPPVPAL